jgi:O-antigen ligase
VANREQKDALLTFDTVRVEDTRAAAAIVFLLGAAIVITTLAYGAVHQPILALFYLGAVALAGLWAADAFGAGYFRFNKSYLQLPLVAMIILGLLQILPLGSLAEAAGVSGIPRTLSLAPYDTQQTVAHFVALLIYFAAALAFIDSGSRLRKVVGLITIFGFAFAFFAILQSVLSPNKIYGIYEPKKASPFGSFVSRANFAALVEMTIALPLGMVFAGAVPKDRRLIYLTAIALMGVALVLSGSRGGLVSLLAIIFFTAFFSLGTRSYGQMLLKIGLAALLVAVVIGGTIFVGGETSLTRIADSAVSKDPSTSRTHIWNTTLKIIADAPVLGNGLGSFGVAYTAKDTLSGLERAEQAHNDYLQVVSDAGLAGAVIGLAFLFFLFRTGFANIKTANSYRRGVALGALAGCFGVLVHSLFDFVLHTTAIALMFLTIAALVVVSRKDKDKEERQHRAKKEEKSASVTAIEEKLGAGEKAAKPKSA